MAINQITKQCREQVESRLAATDGFNATANALFGSSFFNIDFAGNGFNYFRGQLDPEQLSKSSAIRYPILCLFGTKIEDTHKQKFLTFSGPLTIGLDVHLTHPQSKAAFDFEALPDAVETAVFDILNRESNQDWEMTTVYNGDVGLVRFPLQMAASNWRQTLRFMMRFEVHET